MDPSIRSTPLFILKVIYPRVILNLVQSNYYSFVNIGTIGRDVLPAWDRQIQSLCYQVNNIMEKIAAIAPEWMNRAMERVDEQMVH